MGVRHPHLCGVVVHLTMRQGFLIAWLLALTLAYGTLALQLGPIHAEQLETIQHIQTLYNSLLELFNHLDITPGQSV